MLKFTGTFNFLLASTFILSFSPQINAQKQNMNDVVGYKPDHDTCYQKLELANQLIDINPDSALSLVQPHQLCESCRSNSDFRTRAEIIGIGYHFRVGNMLKSIEIGNRLLDSLPDNISPKTFVRLLMDLSAPHQYLARQVRAYQLAFGALTGAIQLRDTAIVIRALNTVGEINQNSNGRDRSLQIYNFALDLARQSNNQLGVAQGNTSIGGYYMRNGLSDSAYPFFSEALRIYQDLDDQERISMMMIRVGRVYMTRGSLDTARLYFSESLSRAKELGAHHAMGRCYHNLGKIEMHENNFPGAIVYLDSAIGALNQVEDLIVLSQAYQVKSRALEEIDQLDSALQYFKRYNKLHDSLDVIRAQEEVQAMELKHILASRDNDILFLNERNEIVRDKQRAEAMARVWLFVALFVVLGIALLLFRMFRQRSKMLTQEKSLRELDKTNSEQQLTFEREMTQVQKEKLDLELDLKNKELTTLTMQMLNKSEGISNIQSQIGELEAGLAKKGTADLQTLKSLRQLAKGNISGPGSDEEWTQFKLYFEKVHQSFFERLKLTHPVLTAYDLKLCAYFHMNLANKQVANMMNISPDAVKKQRTRMRKKMGLDDQTDLLDHIARVTAKKIRPDSIVRTDLSFKI